jgi:hypothetical protein
MPEMPMKCSCDNGMRVHTYAKKVDGEWVRTERRYPCEDCLGTGKSRPKGPARIPAFSDDPRETRFEDNPEYINDLEWKGH